MSEKTKEVKKFQDTMYTLNLHGESIYKYKLLGPFGFNMPRPMVARGAYLHFQSTVILAPDPRKPKRGPVAPMVHGKFEPYGPWPLYS